MIDRPMDILRLFPVRKTKKQKTQFLDAAVGYTRRLGYEPVVEKGAFGSRNLVIGDPEKAKFLVTAHYDTCATLPFPNFITPGNFFLYLAYQLLITVLILAFAFAAALVAGMAAMLLTNNSTICTLVCYIAVYGCLLLLLFGPANKSNANDNTSGVVTLMEIAATIPENQRHKVCFVLFDLEEAGLIGSASYAKRHKRTAASQTVLNLDCVGDGDHIVLYPSRKLKKDGFRLAGLLKCNGSYGTKTVRVLEKGFAFYPSDQSNFAYGVGICALHKSKLGLYLGRIHTRRDTVLEETNVNILRAAITSVVCCDAVIQKGNEQ